MPRISDLAFIYYNYLVHDFSYLELQIHEYDLTNQKYYKTDSIT